MSGLTLGIIADTHGLLRPQALEAFREAHAAHILHLGDVGDAAILDQLRTVAPVTAIRGNIDRGGACAKLPATELVTFAGHALYLLHSRDELDLKPEAAGIAAVLFGHSHRPLIESRAGVLYFNPGAAGPRRFSLPITVGLLHLAPEGIRAEHLSLESV